MRAGEYEQIVHMAFELYPMDKKKREQFVSNRVKAAFERGAKKVSD